MRVELREHYELLKHQRDDLIKRRDESEPRRESTLSTYQLIYNIRTFLPKTDDISHVIERKLDVKEDEIVVAPEDRTENRGGFFGMRISDRVLSDSTSVNPRSLEVRLAARKMMRERSNGWVIGTSVVFEAVVLTLGAWIFCRRDF